MNLSIYVLCSALATQTDPAAPWPRPNHKISPPHRRSRDCIRPAGSTPPHRRTTFRPACSLRSAAALRRPRRCTDSRRVESFLFRRRAALSVSCSSEVPHCRLVTASMVYVNFIEHSCDLSLGVCVQ